MNQQQIDALDDWMCADCTKRERPKEEFSSPSVKDAPEFTQPEPMSRLIQIPYRNNSAVEDTAMDVL